MCVVCLLALASVAPGADPLYLQPPFDEIKLDEDNGGVVLRVKSLELPGRKLPSAAERTEDLEIELLDRPGEKFALPWMNVAGVKFFEQLVLAEADEHVKAARYDEAQPYFTFLEAKHPQTAGLKESVENFLWQQILAAFRAGKHEETLALLVELHGRNPQRTGLDNAWQRVTVELVKADMASGNYRAARGRLRNLAQRFPGFQDSTVAPFETQLQEKAQGLLTAARTAESEGKLRMASESIASALEIWPAITGGRELALAIHERYPVVVVAVTDQPDAGGRSDTWAATSAARLLGRPIAERAPAGAEGGPYQSPLGELTRGESPQEITLRLKPGLQWGQPARAFTAQEVARGLLAQADPQAAGFDPLWAERVAGVEARGLADVQISLRRPLPLPEAWLARPLASMRGATCGPFRIDSRAADVVRFVRQDEYFAASLTKPAEIVQRTYRDPAAALRDLSRGEVLVVDRISPWDLAAYSAVRGVTVRRYEVPTVHALAIHPQSRLARHRSLRRAILYGLDRQSILSRGILAGTDAAGCEVISGPFPRGASGDEFAYAYDAKVENRPYEPATALVLARLANESGGGQTQSLTLVHPAGPVARAACQSIARQLQQIGLPVVLREATPGQEAADPFDLRYVELTIREPVVDAWRVLGPHGIAGTCSPQMLAALRDVDAAPTRAEAAVRLQAVHRLAAAELPVIPLWQLAEHFAYHNRLQGVGESIATLYENVEQWQSQPQLPTE
jgi:hypothetical protein